MQKQKKPVSKIQMRQGLLISLIFSFPNNSP
jgi:hypothetical protein